MKSKKLMPLVLMLLICQRLRTEGLHTHVKGDCRKFRYTAWRSCRRQRWAALHSSNGSNCNREQSERCFYNGFFKYRQHRAWSG